MPRDTIEPGYVILKKKMSRFPAIFMKLSSLISTFADLQLDVTVPGGEESTAEVLSVGG